MNDRLTPEQRVLQRRAQDDLDQQAVSEDAYGAVPPEPDEKKRLPNSVELEQALLGIVFYDNEAMAACAFLDPAAFFEPFHGRVWKFARDKIGKGVLFEPIMLAEAFKNDKAFAELGGIRYVADLFERAPPVWQAPHYAKTLADLKLRRDLILVSQHIAELANGNGDEDLDGAAIAAEAERLVIEAGSAIGGNTDEFQEFGDMMRRSYQRAAEAMNEKVAPGISTGIADLDRVRYRLRKGTVNLLGGRPGMGKSVVGTVLAKNIATGRGDPESENYEPPRAVALYSLEMPEEQTSVRFAAMMAYDRDGAIYGAQAGNPTYEDFEFGKLTDPQMTRVYDAIEDAGELPIFTDYRPNLRVSQIVASVRRWIQRCKKKGIEPGAVIIDHFLHLAAEPGNNMGSVEKYTAISHDLLAAAKKLDIAFVVLCQLGRGVDGRDDKRPSNSDLKWTGALEEDAFSTVFLYRPEYYNRAPEDDHDEKGWAKYRENKEKHHRKLYWIIEKNRGGRGGMQVATFCDIGHNYVADLGGPGALI